MQVAFERDGVAVVRGVVGARELDAMRDVFASLIPEIEYPRGESGVLREITGASRAVEPLLGIACDARFGKLAAEALGARRVQLLQDSLLYKPARDGAPVEWHQDFTYVGFLTPPRVIAIRIALLPEDETNGCMRAVEGSHAWGPVGENKALRAASVTSLLDELPPERRERVEHARVLALEPGDVSIHHCLTLHGSGANPSERPRKTIILRMFDAACRLDRSRLPPGSEAYFPVDDDGHLVASAFPVVHDAM